jgi:hypothetical protein
MRAPRVLGPARGEEAIRVGALRKSAIKKNSLQPTELNLSMPPHWRAFLAAEPAGAMRGAHLAAAA